MKKWKVLFYVFKWMVLVLLTYLITIEVHSERRKILVFLLVIFVAAGLVIEGRREFMTGEQKNNK
jgi:surface polysaccharide O-acyltransferase-like enzyme